MKIKIVWKDNYSVGRTDIDDQHKGLFSLVKVLNNSNLSAQDIKQSIMMLFKYTREHFTAEEEMMRSFNFPGLDSHIVQHEKLIDKLSSVSQNDFEQIGDRENFVEFANDWLIDHILYWDMQYIKYIHKEN